MYRIRSFTISEIIVSMSIASILIYSSFQAYMYLTSEYKKLHAISSYRQCEKLMLINLELDFRNADYIEYDYANMILLFNGKNQIRYQITDKEIVRIGKQSESILADRIIWDPHNIDKTGLLSNLNIDISKYGTRSIYGFEKRYSVEELLKYESKE